MTKSANNPNGAVATARRWRGTAVLSALLVLSACGKSSDPTASTPDAMDRNMAAQAADMESEANNRADAMASGMMTDASNAAAADNTDEIANDTAAPANAGVSKAP